MFRIGPSRPSRLRIPGYSKASSITGVVANWREAYGNNWRQLRGDCLRRDNYTCQRCHMYYPPPLDNKLQAHHIVPLSKIGERGNTLSNLTTLCHSCHDKTHGKKNADFY